MHKKQTINQNTENTNVYKVEGAAGGEYAVTTEKVPETDESENMTVEEVEKGIVRLNAGRIILKIEDIKCTVEIKGGN